MTQQFEGQKLIVIGGTSGIGKSVAQLVLQGGGIDGGVMAGRNQYN